MPEAWDLHDGRLIQELISVSAADALSVTSSVVPPGRVRTILNVTYWPSALETRTIFFNIRRPNGSNFPFTRPFSIALSTILWCPGLTEGLELKLFPGESLQVFRDVATAASTMNIVARYIETDLPYYEYLEPQKKVIKQLQRRGTVGNIIYGRGAAPAGGGPTSGGTGAFGRGPKPI
jgi:hypothetical protein